MTIDGLNRRGEETTETLRRATLLARKAGAAYFAVAGDLFHNRRPEPAVIRRVQDIFDADVMMDLLVPGNHDMLDDTCESGNTAMAPLYRVATVDDGPTIRDCGSLEVLTIPFDGRTSMREHLEKVAPTMKLKGRGPGILITHVGVYTQEEAKPWQVEAKDAISSAELFAVMKKIGARLALVGNYHESHEWHGKEGTIIQLGTLVPATHGDENGGLMALVHADGTYSFCMVPGPRFVDMSLEGRKITPILGYEEGYSYYGRVISGNGDIPAQLPGGWVVIEDERGIAGETTPYAHGVEPPERPADAVLEYVAAMDLPAGVERGIVIERANDYIRRAL